MFTANLPKGLEVVVGNDLPVFGLTSEDLLVSFPASKSHRAITTGKNGLCRLPDGSFEGAVGVIFSGMEFLARNREVLIPHSTVRIVQ
jgi:hypothetical protein